MNLCESHGNQIDEIQIPALSLTSCVNLNKLLKLEKGNENSTYLIGYAVQ